MAELGAFLHKRADLFRAIADTTGAHYDISIEPLVEMMRTVLTSADGIKMINTMLIRIGRVVVKLIEEVQEEAKRKI